MALAQLILQACAVLTEEQEKAENVTMADGAKAAGGWHDMLTSKYRQSKGDLQVRTCGCGYGMITAVLCNTPNTVRSAYGSPLHPALLMPPCLTSSSSTCSSR